MAPPEVVSWRSRHRRAPTTLPQGFPHATLSAATSSPTCTAISTRVVPAASSSRRTCIRTSRRGCALWRPRCRRSGCRLRGRHSPTRTCSTRLGSTEELPGGHFSHTSTAHGFRPPRTATRSCRRWRRRRAARHRRPRRASPRRTHLRPSRTGRRTARPPRRTRRRRRRRRRSRRRRRCCWRRAFAQATSGAPRSPGRCWPHRGPGPSASAPLWRLRARARLVVDRRTLFAARPRRRAPRETHRRLSARARSGRPAFSAASACVSSSRTPAIGPAGASWTPRASARFRFRGMSC
mmetsp:Transcript_17938/g.55720  ORF Transcript_17938/g.55720 Transcript_17938/m.55720 type:complete len:294 (+) Transcript_17938:686-1567(+)